MNRRPMFIVLSVVVIVVGVLIALRFCEEDSGGDGTSGPPVVIRDPDRVPVEDITVVPLLCKYKRIDTARDCPSTDGLRTTAGAIWRLSDQLNAREPNSGAKLADSAWCAYEYQWNKASAGDAPIPSETTLLDDLKSLARDRLDCKPDRAKVVSLQGITSAPSELAAVTTFPDLYTSLGQQAGVRARCGSSAEWTANSSRVLVALVDSLPPNPSTNGGTKAIRWSNASQHGSSLGMLIREFSGPAPQGATNTCATEVLTTLALDTVMAAGVGGAAGTRLLRADGGTLGSESSVARAIRQALELKGENHKSKKLIINLSIGWEPKDTTFGAAGSPVLDAIRDAVDAGALVIAAAGNRSSLLPDYEGFMYPAAYAQLSYPCEISPDTDGPESCPLVIPVSGVDGGDQLLMVARPKGVPHLLAPAQGALGNPALLGKPMPTNARLLPLTGTSVAAALVSAAAARVWALNSDWTADRVMTQLWNTARSPQAEAPLPSMVEAALSPPICHNDVPYSRCDEEVTPKIVSFCHATDGVPTDEPCYPTVKNRVEVFSTVDSSTVPKVVFQDKGLIPVPTECGPNYTFRHGGQGAAPQTAENFCPERLLSGDMLADVVHPQPPGTGCDECVLVPDIQNPNNYTLFLSMNESLPVLEQPQLTMVNPTTQITQTIRLGIPTLTAGQRVVVTGLQIDDFASFTQALVSGTVPQTNDLHVVMDQILR